MQLPSLANLTDEKLHTAVKALKDTENQTLAEIILHLSEIDSRGIYRGAGYSSLYTYCREALGYSEGATYRRMRAARCLKASPEIYELIRDGKLSLSAITEVSTVITEENKAEVLKKAEGASRREAERIKVEFGAPSKPTQQRITPKIVAHSPAKAEETAPVIEERFRFAFEVTDEVRELYEEAREIAGTSQIAEVFEKALKAFVQKHRPRKVIKRTSPGKLNPNSRYISRSVRNEVLNRDDRQCTFVSPEGTRCSERCGLHLDHIQPFANGGPSTVDNLRLLCPTHNQLHAEISFGTEFMRQKRSEKISDAFSERTSR